MTKLVEFPALRLRDKLFPRENAAGLLPEPLVSEKVSLVAQP